MQLRTTGPRVLLGLTFALAATVLVGTRSMAQTGPVATADVRDAQGTSLGTATFRQVSDGVLVEAELRNVPGKFGPRGIHIHQFGDCNPPNFERAGSHYNPTDQHHGVANPNGPHLGDLINQENLKAGSNVEVMPDGTARVRMLAPDASVGPGPAALVDGDGAALVIHSDADDNRTNPSGNSGPRTACGVLTVAER